MSLGAVYCVYDACPLLSESVKRIYPVVDKIVFLINFRPWSGEFFQAIPGTVTNILEISDVDKKFEVIIGHWGDEATQRNVGLKVLKGDGIDWCLVVDDDEFFNEHELRALRHMLENNAQHAAYLIYHQIYWKDTETVIEGLFGSFPTFARTDGTVRFNENRMILVNEGHTWYTISSDSIVCHHMSYVRTDKAMRRKIESFSHASEIISDWYEKIWKGDVTTDLHPTHGSQFKKIHPVSESKYQLESIQ